MPDLPGTPAPSGDAGTGARLRHLIRAVKAVAADGRIPRPLRWGAALGLAPVPGPFDEIVLVAVGAVLWLAYRDQLRQAWHSTRDA